MKVSRRVLTLACAVAPALSWCFALGCGEPAPPDVELADYRQLRGDLLRGDTSESRARGRYVVQRVRLTSSSGLAATGWLVHPAADGCFAAVLLQDGREENSGVVGRLPAEFGDVVVLSLDYPSEIPYTVRLSDLFWRGTRLRQSARKIPAAFSLGASYLAQRRDVDTTRLAIAATSFAVPFAAIASAADERFRNVALIYGAGDLPSVLAANMPNVAPHVVRRWLAGIVMKPYADFAPERFIGHIAPRPLIMVNGIDDPQMPAEAARHLYDAAREPKTMIWLRTGHLMPTDSALIRTLIDTAFARLPILHRDAKSSRCARSSERPG